MSFDTIKERDLLCRLAALHDDGDVGESISASDLSQPAADGILKELTVDDFIIGDLDQKAKRLTEYFSRIKVGIYLNMETAEIREDGSILFSSYREFDPVQFEDIYKTVNTISRLLRSRLHSGDKTPVKLVDPRPDLEATVFQGGSVRVSEAVLDEFKKTYDCQTERLFLLFVNRRTGIIDKVLRTNDVEAERYCAFGAGWQNYVHEVLRDSGSEYEIAGDYHSHLPGGRSGFNLSPDDNIYPWEGVLQMLGLAKTQRCDLQGIDESFRVSAFDRERTRYPIEEVPSDDQEVYLDSNIFKPYENYAVAFSTRISFGEIRQWFKYIASSEQFYPSVLAEMEGIFKRAKHIRLHVNSTYNGSYYISIRTDDISTTSFEFILDRTSRNGRDYNLMQGRLSLDMVRQNSAYSVGEDHMSFFMSALASLLSRKLPASSASRKVHVVR